MNEQELSGNDSLKIIMEMVQSTKYNIAQDKFIYLMWGYAVSISAMVHYVLEFQMNLKMAWLVWLTMPAAGIATGIYYSRKIKQSTAKTFTDRALAGIWTSFIIALFIFLFAAPELGWRGVYPVLMVLYGIGTSTTGTILKYKPLVVGGYLSMLIGLIAFYMSFEIQLFLLAMAVIVSFVIPGHLLPKKVTI